MAPLSKWIDTIPAGGRVSDAARASLEARLATVAYWLPLAARQIDDDIEKVHQLRVATRRAIAAVDLYREWLPPGKARWLERRLKRIRRAAGAARDLDVLTEWMRTELNGQAGSLLAMLGDERAAAQPKIMSVADKCEAENRFRRKMYGALADVRPRGKVRKKQDVSYRNWAEMRLGKAAESFFAALPTANSDLSALHQFRIRGKHLRYTLELLAPAFGPELREQHYSVVQELQELLGRINDCVSADERLRRWRRKIDTVYEQGLLDSLVERQRGKLDEAIGDYRGWWTMERAESLRQGLAGLIGSVEPASRNDPVAAMGDSSKDSEESAVSQA